MEQPDPRDLREARARFSALLKEPRVPESAWQILFAECPFILSAALPLKLSHKDITPLGRRGCSEPDLIFFPRSRAAVSSSYGVIELKRADARILRKPRKNIITLSATASTAVAQARHYLRELDQRMWQELPRDALFLGNLRLAFVLMGLSDELVAMVVDDVLQRQFRDLLGDGLQLLPYDTLYDLFAANSLPRLIQLEPHWELSRRGEQDSSAEEDEADEYAPGSKWPFVLDFGADRKTGLKITAREVLLWLRENGLFSNSYAETMDDATWEVSNIVLGPNWKGKADLDRRLREYVNDRHPGLHYLGSRKSPYS